MLLVLCILNTLSTKKKPLFHKFQMKQLVIPHWVGFVLNIINANDLRLQFTYMRKLKL